VVMHLENELPHLVKLLDDEEPAVRKILLEHFATLGGDLSTELSQLGIDLPEEDRTRLGQLLAPGRRRHLRNQWIIPAQGLDESTGDWESFELLLRLLSELLHDGTSIRPTLPDALDQLSDEAVLHDAHHDEKSLCDFLFGSGMFRANKSGFYHPGNSDLLWIIAQRKGNPIGLAVLAMLVAHRLNLRIAGCNFPAHFLGWLTIDGKAHLVDCYGAGRLIPVAELRTNSAVLSPDSRRAIEGPCSMREILLRILGNLHLAFSQQRDRVDAELIEELVISLAPPS
jgi:regulator of sirC expression with transglutaminase-like and TPR domain